MKRVYSAAIMFSFFIGLSFLFTKISLGFTDTNIVLAHRFTLGYFVFMLYRRLLGLRLLPSLSDIVSILPIAICYPIAFFITQGLGLNYLTSSEGGMIHALVPGVTLLLSSLFLKEKVNFLKLFFTTSSVTGVIFMFTMKNVNITDMNILGVVYASLSVIVSSIYTLLAKSKLKKFNYNDLTYVMLFIGFIFLNFFYLLRTEPSSYLDMYFGPLVNPQYTLSVVYLGVFSTVLSSLLSNYSLTKLPASKVSVFNNLATLISIFAGTIVLNEPFYNYHFIGAVLILVGVIGVNYKKELATEITDTPKGVLNVYE